MISLYGSAAEYRAVSARWLPGFAIHFVKLTHWGRVTHKCVSKQTIIGSDNGLSPDRRQAIIWTNAVLLLIGPLGTNFSEILIEIPTFSFKKMRLKVSSAKRRPFCLGLNVLSWTIRLIQPQFMVKIPQRNQVTIFHGENYKQLPNKIFTMTTKHVFRITAPLWWKSSSRFQ